MKTRSQKPSIPVLTLALGVLVFAWVTFGENLGFPYYYHSDEPIKALQVESQTFNFHHPMLLLGTVNVLRPFVLPTMSEKSSLQALTELGRSVSAWFLSFSVLFLALVGFGRYRYAGLLMTAALLLNNPHLYEHGRFFKEDAALLFGVAAVLAALTLWERRPRDVVAALLLGVSFGLVVSAKYIGILAIIVAVPAMIFCPGTRRGSSRDQEEQEKPATWKSRGLAALYAVAAGGLVFGLINIQPLSEPDRWRSAFEREVDVLVSDAGRQETDEAAGFNFTATEEIAESLPEPVFWFAGIFALGFFVQGLWRRPSLMVLVGFTLLYFVALGCSERFSQRYLMPLSALLTVMAGFGVIFLYLQLLRFQAWARFVPVLLRSGRLLQFGMIAAGVWLLFDLWDLKWPIRQSFAQDDRAALQSWIEENLPPDAVIVQDMDTKLPAPDYRFVDTAPPVEPQKVVTIRDFEKLGVEELRDQGATHLAFTQKDYRKIKRLLEDVEDAGEEGKSAEQAWAEAAEKRPFWTRIARDGKLLKFSEKGLADVMQPGLWLYELPEEQDPGVNGSR